MDLRKLSLALCRWSSARGGRLLCCGSPPDEALCMTQGAMCCSVSLYHNCRRRSVNRAPADHACLLPAHPLPPAAREHHAERGEEGAGHHQEAAAAARAGGWCWRFAPEWGGVGLPTHAPAVDRLSFMLHERMLLLLPAQPLTSPFPSSPQVREYEASASLFAETRAKRTELQVQGAGGQGRQCCCRMLVLLHAV